MEDPVLPEILSPEATRAALEAIHAAKNAAQAVETARALQLVAMNENTTKSLVEALRQVFGEYTEQQRFIDTKRIPLICKQIEDIHSNIADIKQMFKTADTRYVNQDVFWPVRTIVYGLTGVLLLGVGGALLSLIIKG